MILITFRKDQSHINMYLAQIQGYDNHFEDTHELNDIK